MEEIRNRKGITRNIKEANSKFNFFFVINTHLVYSMAIFLLVVD